MKPPPRASPPNGPPRPPRNTRWKRLQRALTCLLLVGQMMSTASALPLLTNVAQVKALDIAQASQGYPVRLRGVVTYLEPDGLIAFLEDTTGGVYFKHRNAKLGLAVDVTQGAVIELAGQTTAGRFAPYVSGPDWTPVEARILGRGSWPNPRRLELSDLANPANHSSWVAVAGSVRAVRPGPARGELELSTLAGRFRAVVPASVLSDAHPERLVGAVLELNGVYGSLFNPEGEIQGMRLFVPRPEDVTVREPGRDGFEDRPVSPVGDLLRFRSTLTPRARVQGTVTLGVPGHGVYVRDATGALWVDSPQVSGFPAGSQVDAVGFPALERGRPVLRDAFLELRGYTPHPPAPLITAEQAASGRFHADRIRVRARIVDRLEPPGEALILMQAGKRLFRVRLTGTGSAAAELLPGSEVEVTGVCVNDFLIDTAGTGDTPPRYRSEGFELLLGDPSELRPLRPPPFWTVRRMAWLAAAVAGGCLLAFAWALGLRAQVARQTAIIRSQHAREAVIAERARIARELHDSLEQNLAGIHLQLDAAREQWARSPDIARGVLDDAAAWLRHSREETRRSVWDLRSAALERGDLAGALHDLTAVIHGTLASRVKVTASSPSHPLPGPIAAGLLRIGQEAIRNALRHAGNGTVAVDLSFHPDRVVLTVADEGDGFDPSTAPGVEAGHFGLTGMRERAERLGARLEIQTSPGRGTRVVCEAPLPPATGSTKRRPPITAVA